MKQYTAECYYHIFNRGVEKRVIFLDDQDYLYFKKLLYRYIAKPPDLEFVTSPSLYGEVELHSFCLMPNHFHLLVKQSSPRGIVMLMHRLSTAYSMYFNMKYDRVGKLFQGCYKARMIASDSDLMNITRYIHNNPKGMIGGVSVYEHSSYQYYLKGEDQEWLIVREVLQYFKNPAAYRDFVEGGFQGETLQGLTLKR